eukprot:TRINITY_DN12102_c0_g1_i1.p1 TRINITY_DN12102_c0_g1~~TRINITY_DN12102_c0_g1_i1.p1  ORF type:complete len:297 (+),score=27.34 TRINITY_DN12102_c0_g1_i1:293-1183(+)
MSGNFTASCIPHFSVFEDCPERQNATRIHFMAILAFNFLAGVVLIFTLIRRVMTFKPVEWSNFYTILTGLAAGNFLLSIADSLIIRGDFVRVPVWIISGLLMLGGNLGTISCMYTICTWMEVLDSTSFLVYSGLKSYRGLFWGTSIAHVIISMAFAIVAGLSGDLYLLFWRLEWGYWAFMLFGGLSILLVYGIRTMRVLHQAGDKKIFMFTITNLFGIGLTYIVTNIIQVVLLDKIDRTPWAWHLYWVVFGAQNAFLSLVFCIWSLYASGKRAKSSSSAATSKTAGATYSGSRSRE